MKTIKIIIGAVIVILIAVGISYAITPKSDGTAGAVPTHPPTYYPYLQAGQALGLGGIQTSSFTTNNAINLTGTRLALTTSTGTTTSCSIQNPFTATSTISSIDIQTSSATTTITSVAIATSTNAFSTTTTNTLLSTTLAANAFGTFTFDGSVNNNILGPGQSIIVTFTGTGAGAGGGSQIAGVCNAVINSI